MSVKLFYLPDACSLHIHILLKEVNLKGVEYIRCKRSRNGVLAGDEFLTKYNPKGRVPALQVEDGTVFTEAQVVTLYLSERFPEAKLLPTEGKSKWDALSLLNFIATDFHLTFNSIFQLYAPEEFKVAHRAGQLARNFRYLDSVLEGKKYLLGDDFSAVDSYAYTVSRWAVYAKCDCKPYPNLISWQKRVEKIPSVQKALKEERLPLLHPEGQKSLL